MKIFLILLINFFLNVKSTSSNINIYARNYIVYDYNSEEILEGKDYDKSYSVASISKIMTAIIALESERLFDVITVDEVIEKVEGSSLYLSIGDEITIIDLVYGLLLRSGNDAAVLIASNICKTIEEFVDLMNQKAREIKMENTLFNNPSGLDIFDEGNLSSCLDMAKLMAYCLDNELFCQIISTKYYKNPIKGAWTNKNRLLHQYEYCLGGKTGYTKKARRTLVTCAEKDYQKLIVVTLDCGNDFSFHKNIYEYYFNNYQYLVFLQEGKNYIDNYYIYSKKVVGLRINKDVKSGVKMYYLNPINNTLLIKFISSSNQEEIVLEKTFEVYFYKNY